MMIKHTLIWLTNEQVKISYRPVHLYILTDDVEMILGGIDKTSSCAYTSICTHKPAPNAHPALYK